MKLITQELKKKLLANGANREGDHVPVMKLFVPWGAGTWLITEMDPEEPDILFGLCDLGMQCPELGSVSLAEITSVKGPFGLKIERDMNWSGNKPISQYAEEARAAGRIVA